MPRALRIQYPGATYHVMARGNRREAIFRDDRDFQAFLDRLDTACRRTGWEIRAFVLMGNHYHLVVHTPEANLVEGMRWLQNAYTRYFNTRHRDWGRVFGDRYKSVLVEEAVSFGGRGTARGDYLTTLIDYVHLNPARAGLIQLVEKQSMLDYPWSSLALAYAVAPGKRAAWMDVATGLGLAQCPDTVAGRRQCVRRLDERAMREQAVAAGAGEAEIEGQTLNSTLRRGWYWGSEAFREWLLSKAGDGAVSNPDYRISSLGRDHAEAAAEELVVLGCRELGLDPESDLRRVIYGDHRRMAIAWAIAKRTSVPQNWIVERLGMKSRQNVSQQVRRFDRMPFQSLPKALREWKRKLTIND
ncbi:MAG: transposase [Verrucomicrobiae bacterium]|nr:transposase [Verrucomicrobiae bacterium]